MLGDVKSHILSRCHEVGACTEKYKALLDCGSVSEIISVYKENPTWCMEIGFPTLGEIRKYFADQQSEGIFVDCEFNGERFSSQQIYVFHHCNGHIRVAMDYENAVIPILYFCNDCEIHIECDQHNVPAIKIPIYSYGSNFITTEGKGNAIFNRYEYDVK